MTGALATRLAGSADIFAVRSRPPSRSVNFVTAHDGFTLADLVAHETKHNAANGEDNRDGTDANFSWNHGVEGATDDAAVRAARARDVRSLLATLLVSRGTPMLTMGDELGRTQHGNNNTYAQDNALAWVDWDRADRALADFTGALVALLVMLVISVADVVGGGRVLAADATAPRPVTTRTVVVEQGDSLWLIAGRTAPDADPREVVTRIRELNGMRSNLIHPGQALLVPSTL